MENVWMVGLLVAALAVALWVGYSAFAAPAPAVVENTETNRVYFEQQAAASSNECGDLNDPQNIQHLSHHPDRYQDCLRQVDPAKFREAVGDDLSNYLR